LRILIADSLYPPFLAGHYRADPGMAERPYAEQLEALLARSFGTGDAYSAGLRDLGHETADLVLNCEPLQASWAREHGVRSAAALWPWGGLPSRAGRLARQAALHAVAVRQIREFAPDVLYLQDLGFFRPRELGWIRRRGAVVAGQIASRAPADRVLRAFDLIFTSFPHFVERLGALGVGAEYLPIAFDERVLDRLRGRGVDPSPGSDRPHGVTIVGGLEPKTHPNRIALLEAAGTRLGVEVWGYGVEALPTGSEIRGLHRGEAWGLDMYEVLARSKIVVNVHEGVAEGNVNNMRLFEATGAGAMLLTDRGANLAELFEPEAEVATFGDAEELVSRAEHFLANDDERLAIAAAGQARTLAEHTYGHRLEQVSSRLEAFVAGGPEPD
jgi:spore maturation protein CgeB